MDLEAELAQPEVQGHIIKVQVKASKAVKVKNGFVDCRISRRHLNYAMTCRVPVILVVVDVTKKVGWYLWLQRWTLNHIHGVTEPSNLPRVVRLKIPSRDKLSTGIAGYLKKVASWRTQEQLVMSLLDCIRCAMAVQEGGVIEPVARLLKDLGQPTGLFPVGALIDEVVSLEQRMWGTDEGYKLSEILHAVCEKYGDKFSREQIFRLVIRNTEGEEGFSRTGINALSFLYRRYPKHVFSLALPELFGNHADGLPRYFCQLLKKYRKALKNPFFFCSEDLDLKIGKWDIPKESRDRLFDKLVNRGDSALLDFVWASA